MQPETINLIAKGGPVMWPLALLSLFGFFIFIERALYLHQGQIRTNDFLDGIRNLLRKGRLIEAVTVCEETPGPVAAIVKAALINHDRPETAMRSSLQSAALVEIPALQRRVGSLAAIGRVAPLIGLLGTVMGLVEAFQDLQAAGVYAQSSVLAGGLSQALLTTGAGLAIAIMAFMAHHFLNGRVRALVHDMEFAGHHMLQHLLQLRSEGENTSAPTENTASPTYP